MENFENQEDWKKENQDKILRAESMFEEVVHLKSLMNKSDKGDDFDPNYLGEKMLKEIIEERKQYSDYFDSEKNILKDLLFIGKAEEIIRNLLIQKEKVLKILEGDLNENKKKEIQEEINKTDKVLNELRKRVEDTVILIEKYANADKPEGVNIKKDKNIWKN